jgi:hypothetical protein
MLPAPPHINRSVPSAIFPGQRAPVRYFSLPIPMDHQWIPDWEAAHHPVVHVAGTTSSLCRLGRGSCRPGPTGSWPTAAAWTGADYGWDEQLPGATVSRNEAGLNGWLHYLAEGADLRRFDQTALDAIAAELNGRPRQTWASRHPHRNSRRRCADPQRPPTILRPSPLPAATNPCAQSTSYDRQRHGVVRQVG